MNIRCWIALVVATQVCIIGCNKPSKSTADHGNVAIVDLDKAANQLGLSDQWTTQLDNQKTKVNQQLVEYQKQLNQQLESKKAEVIAASDSKESLTKPQQVELATYQQQLNGKLQQAKTQAEQHISKTRSQIIQNFRNMAKQISLEVALENGYDVVLTKNDSVVFNYSPESDITSHVVTRLQQQLAAKPQETARE